MTFHNEPTRHLTHEQLANLLLADRPSDTGTFDSEEIERSAEHLRGCALCAGELDSLRQSLELFRSTADAWAQHAWESTLDRRGAMPCLGLFTLGEFLSEVGDLDITTGTT